MMMRIIVLLFTLLVVQVSAQKWLVAYYMPYDNDLDKSSEYIIKESFNGIKSPNLTIVFQSDRLDSTGMRRVVLNSGRIDTVIVGSENSAHTSSIKDYLNWIEEEYSFDKMALIFLNHGGKLDEIGLDETPVESWMKIDSLAAEVKSFNQRTGNKIELLHLQVCSKANIEVGYEFRDCSKYTMFSQFVLGAPNYYYRHVYQSLSLQPNISGAELAKQIAHKDSLFMYYNYSCVDNDKWDLLDSSLNNYLSACSKNNMKRVKGKIRNTQYMDQVHWDVVSLINNFSLKRSGKHTAKELVKCLKEELLVFNVQNPNVPQIKGFSGLSILAFTENENLEKYQNLQFYQTFDLAYYYQAVLKEL